MVGWSAACRSSQAGACGQPPRHLSSASSWSHGQHIRAPTTRRPGYVLTLPLGTGAQGTVWRATRVADRADRAIKVVASCGADALAGSVDNPDMVRVHEVPHPRRWSGGGRHGPDGRRFLAWPGRRQRCLTSGETVSLLVPLAQALGRLHALGLVHGDVTGQRPPRCRRATPVDRSRCGPRARTGRTRSLGHGRLRCPEVAVGWGPHPASDGMPWGPGVVRPHRARTAVGVPPFGRDRKEGVVSEPPDEPWPVPPISTRRSAP